MISTSAFEDYRDNAPKPVSLVRLALGVLVIVACWVATTVLFLAPPVLLSDDHPFNTKFGNVALLLTFSGLWIGVWVAMRFIHREPLANLMGASGRLSWTDFRKGVAAMLLAHLLAEALTYLAVPTFMRSAVPTSQWLAVLVPMTLFCLLQTSAEEVVFRGYLMRGLANRFRSPWVWALLPSILFIIGHYSEGMTPYTFGLTLGSIGALTILFVVLVTTTGNLGAAMGVHMANNFFVFMLVSHQDAIGSFALFQGVIIDDDAMPTAQALALVGIGWISLLAAAVLLLNRRSPLAVTGAVRPALA